MQIESFTLEGSDDDINWLHILTSSIGNFANLINYLPSKRLRKERLVKVEAIKAFYSNFLFFDEKHFHVDNNFNKRQPKFATNWSFNFAN